MEPSNPDPVIHHRFVIAKLWRGLTVIFVVSGLALLGVSFYRDDDTSQILLIIAIIEFTISILTWLLFIRERNRILRLTS